MLRQLEPAVIVRGPDHRDVTADAVESGALVGEVALDLTPALQLHAEFHEERDGGIHVLGADADVVHPLDRDAGFSFFLVRPVVAADAPRMEPVSRSRHPRTHRTPKDLDRASAPLQQPREPGAMRVRSDRAVVGRRRHGARTQDHERVFQGRHHGEGKPVELKAERDVIRVDSLTHALRQLGGGARLGSAAEEPGSVRPSPGGPVSDVVSARQIFIGLSALAGDHKRDTVTPACPQEPSRCLRHHEAGAQDQRRVLDRKGADRACRGLLHNGPSAQVNGPQQARRVDQVEPWCGRPVLERRPIRVASLERQGVVQRLSKNDLFRPWAKAQAATVKARMTSTTTATDGASTSSAMPTKRESIPIMIAHARPERHARRRHVVASAPSC